MFTIEPTSAAIAGALEAWTWIGLGARRPVIVTAFGDLFFDGPDGIWFLDSSVEGTLKKVAETRVELDALLASEEKQDHYFLAGFVERASQEGMRLKAGECYDFKVHPRLGGPVVFENVEIRDFEVTLQLRGQLHEQIHHVKPGTTISKMTIDAPKKPWWKW